MNGRAGSDSTSGQQPTPQQQTTTTMPPPRPVTNCGPPRARIAATGGIKVSVAAFAPSANVSGKPTGNLSESALTGGKKRKSPPSASIAAASAAASAAAATEPLTTDVTAAAAAAPGATKAAVKPPAAAASSGSKGAKKQDIGSLPPLDRSGKNLSEKKIRRLEKNRLSARECRRKKKEAAQTVQKEIIRLEAENLRLRLQLQIGDEAEASSWEEQSKLTEELEKLLKSGASESEIYASIEKFKEKHVDYGRDRRSAMEFHLRQVERLLMPTTTTSVAMRALQGGEIVEGMSAISENLSEGKATAAGSTNSGIDSPSRSGNPEITDDRKISSKPSETDTISNVEKGKPRDADALAEVPSSADTDLSSTASSVEDASTPISGEKNNTSSASALSLEPKSMFHFLVKHLGVTPQQAAALKDSRLIAKELDSALTESLSVLEELRLRLTQVGDDLETEMDSVRAILTPTQAAKFLVWVSNNTACMHMLNELWNKSYSDSSPEEASS